LIAISTISHTCEDIHKLENNNIDDSNDDCMIIAKMKIDYNQNKESQIYFSYHIYIYIDSNWIFGYDDINKPII